MGKEILYFGDIEIEKNKFFHHKTPILLGYVQSFAKCILNLLGFAENLYLK